MKFRVRVTETREHETVVDVADAAEAEAMQSEIAATVRGFSIDRQVQVTPCE